METTGLSPIYGDRAIEVGAVEIENGKVVERFQELMDPGRPISAFIKDDTGITNQMLKSLNVFLLQMNYSKAINQ